MKLDRVVVAVDFSERSLEAARWVARDVARGVELVLVHVLHVPEPPAFLRGRYPSLGTLVESARAGAEQRLRELADGIATTLIWTEVREGAPDDGILGVADDYHADLIALGAHGERAGAWRVLGTTAERVLRRSGVPVLVARGELREPPSRLLVAIDDSPDAVTVLRWARLLAERSGAATTVVHVLAPQFITPTDPLSASAAVGIAPTLLEVGPAMRHATEQWIAERIAECGPSDASPAVEVGVPAEGILAAARAGGADLIVVGSRGAGRVRRAMLGSVAESVLRGADRPVLVVPPPTDDLGG